MMASCMVVSSSCSKDDDEIDNGKKGGIIEDMYEVVGTTWSESSSFSSVFWKALSRIGIFTL